MAIIATGHGVDELFLLVIGWSGDVAIPMRQLIIDFSDLLYRLVEGQLEKVVIGYHCWLIGAHFNGDRC